MIVVINSLGGLVSIQDEDLFQGSTKLNKIDLVAPFADNVVWKANFEMPDGTIKPEDLDGYLLTPSMRIVKDLNVWKLDVTFPITQDYGIVTMQLRGYIGDTIVCTTSIKLPIQKGVPYDSDYTEITDKEQLLKLIEDIRALTNTKVDKVNYNYKLAENITADSVGIYYVYDYDTETYKNVTLPQGYKSGTEYYELLNTSRVTNTKDGLFLEYVDNSNNQSVKLKVTADGVTINDKQVVVFDDLKAENISFDGSVSGLKAENVQEAIEEVQENIDNSVNGINADINIVRGRVEEVNTNLTNKINKDINDLENRVVKLDTKNLLNYYLKSETYTKAEVNNIVSKINSFKREVVNVLPTGNIDENTIYLVPVEKAEGNNYYEEYLYINGRWELIGTTQVDLSNYYDKDTTDNLLLTTHKQILLGADGVIEENVYNFTVESPESYIEYRTNGTKFLVDLHLPVAGEIDNAKEVAITFGDTTYYVYNILKGRERVTIGDLRQVNKYNNTTGYRFIVEMTFFENADIKGFAIIPTVSISDVLSLTSDEMDAYMAEGGLNNGQLAICKKVITNGYTEGGLYRFDITYPDTYAWTELSGGSGGVSQEDFDKLVNNETQIGNTNNSFKAAGATNALNWAIAIGLKSSATYNGVALGENANVGNRQGVAIGYNAVAGTKDSGVYGNIAIGTQSKSEANKAIQLGTGTNSTENSLQIASDNIYNHKTHTLTVQNIELNGNNVYGILLAISPPTETTKGAVGQFYLDITNKVLYQCVGLDSEVSAGGGESELIYIWKVVGAGGGLSLINVNDTITTSDLKEVVNLTDEQYSELVKNGSITVDRQTITLNDNTIYVTPDVSKPNTLTFSGTNVLTSNETFNSHVHVMVEFETDSIHAGFDCVLHPYDEAVCFVTYNVLVNGSPNFGTAYLDENGQVVINVPSGLTFTNVHGKYVVYGG